MFAIVVALIVLSVGAVAVAAWVQLREKSRQEVVERTLGTSASTDVRRAIRRGLPNEDQDSLRAKMLRKAPSVWSANQSIQGRLIQAGYDNPVAPLTYSMLRVLALVLFPMLVLILLHSRSFIQVIVSLVAAALIGLMLPPFVLLRLVSRRQDKVRRSLPDCLDLLVVCVEAGISLDAAILRVARDLTYVHPQLAGELLVVSRKTNAGMTREEALRGLWDRTGVEEVRTLVASLVQSEKWGSSSSRVLRVSAETLRRKRRHAAEKKAATAPLKMIVPMAIFIFPALFVVVLGPAVIQIVNGFGK
ncbi:MAG: type II secretion system F family protein [Gemmatimonadaceae bacterium]